MLPVYTIDPIKIIHFDYNFEEIVNKSASRNQIHNMERGLTPRLEIIELNGEVMLCVIFIRYTNRFINFDEKICFGSYISEQVFSIKYVNDEYTKSQIEDLFNKSIISSSQEFEKLVIKNNLPRKIKFPNYQYYEYSILEMLEILQGGAK